MQMYKIDGWKRTTSIIKHIFQTMSIKTKAPKTEQNSKIIELSWYIKRLKTRS